MHPLEHNGIVTSFPVNPVDFHRNGILITVASFSFEQSQRTHSFCRYENVATKNGESSQFKLFSDAQCTHLVFGENALVIFEHTMHFNYETKLIISSDLKFFLVNRVKEKMGLWKIKDDISVDEGCRVKMTETR